MQEANGPFIVGQEPEHTITTVCLKCNNEWKSGIESKCKSRLKKMLLNERLVIDLGGMKISAECAVLRAMVFESITPNSGNEQFFTREERIAFKEKQIIPERTRVVPKTVGFRLGSVIDATT